MGCVRGRDKRGGQEREIMWTQVPKPKFIATVPTARLQPWVHKRSFVLIMDALDALCIAGFQEGKFPGVFIALYEFFILPEFLTSSW